MWEKIVLNLISNALKFTFEGRVRVSLAARGDEVELEVEDTGTGIPEHELPHVFDRFHRVQGARARTQEGSGIGLALVQELARMLGGNVVGEERRSAWARRSPSSFRRGTRRGASSEATDRAPNGRAPGRQPLRRRSAPMAAERGTSPSVAVAERPECLASVWTALR